MEGIVTASPTPMAKRQTRSVSSDDWAAAGDSICAADQASTPAVIVTLGPQTPISTEEGTMDAMYPHEKTLLICRFEDRRWCWCWGGGYSMGDMYSLSCMAVVV